MSLQFYRYNLSYFYRIYTLFGYTNISYIESKQSIDRKVHCKWHIISHLSSRTIVFVNIWWIIRPFSFTVNSCIGINRIDSIGTKPIVKEHLSHSAFSYADHSSVGNNRMDSIGVTLAQWTGWCFNRKAKRGRIFFIHRQWPHRTQWNSLLHF